MSEPNPTSDDQLMSAVQGGDLARLGELFERHHARLFNFFLRLTGDRGASEDLVQEVFLRILKYRHTWRSDGDFTAWMFTLARNASTDRFRSRPKLEVQPEEDAPEPPAPEPSVLAALERAEDAGRLRQALLRLPVERREALVLARWGELDYETIGALLGCSVGAVKLRVHRALKQLRQIYLGEIEEVSA